MNTALTPEQIEIGLRYLDSLRETTQLRGEKYFLEGRVGELEPYKGGVGFRAVVSGGADYRVKLRFTDDDWFCECSCPVGFDCKHCCAALLKALDESEAHAAPEQDAGDGSGKFSTALRTQLDRKLTGWEQRAADAVDNLFKNFRHEKLIGEHWLNPITGRKGRTWDLVEVWPAEPQTAWEAWLYIAALLRREKWMCPQGLSDVTDWGKVDALIATGARNEAVDQWREWLRDAAQKFESESPENTELRVRLVHKGAQLEWRKPGASEFSPVKQAAYDQFVSASQQGRLPFDEPALAIWRVFHTGYGGKPLHEFGKPDTARVLNQLLRLPGFEERTAGIDGQPLRRAGEPLHWRVEAAVSEADDYRLALVLPDGSTPPPALALLDGEPSLFVTRDTIFHGPPLGGLQIGGEPVKIPAEAVETGDGVVLFDRLGIAPPPRLAERVRSVRLRAVFHCEVKQDTHGSTERLLVTLRAESAPGIVHETFGRDGWKAQHPEMTPPDVITRYDRSGLRHVPELIEALRVNWDNYDRFWHRPIKKPFPGQFAEWLAAVPKGVEVELDPLLSTLRGAPVEARVKLEVEEAGIDWFDLRVALDVPDSTLTTEELRALLDARGGFVRLGAKGWHRLHFLLSEEEEKQLADLGLSARDFSSEPQRLHALQLAGKKSAARLLPSPQVAAINRRASEILTSVMPDLPSGLRAALRPYQIEGFHFLAYLSANHFGGVLADDMGLGKTVQALAWLLWLRALPGFDGHPSLVVCPKSVTENWAAEAAKFAPGLRVCALPRGARDVAVLKKSRADADIVVVNYTQLRLLEKAITSAPWHAAILDEAQYIKNPESQTARAAWALRAGHRIALSGTPIENKLLDLWSIMGFAMPGVLGNRAYFSKTFDQRTDPLARQRLAARVRPFVLRRTKSEVAKDLPDRIEEDLHCELEGEQATLYRAELKRARAALLKIDTKSQLDKQRFNILTSLLRLRQICCHPALVSAKAKDAESAKMNALFDVLEPLIEEGHKVLVFSQFVEMLAIIRAEIARREWPQFLLTGGTEDRGALVNTFQTTEGPAVFLISLRAGGFGLNLTAASYVVLYDPWWNPAVENQAIDRTHRIGQTSHVIAYRLLVKDTIEEKIRLLQKQKRALAADILGEENFARTLTLDDFRFLFDE